MAIQPKARLRRLAKPVGEIILMAAARLQTIKAL
jgi:hypothetical protein